MAASDRGPSDRDQNECAGHKSGTVALGRLVLLMQIFQVIRPHCEVDGNKDTGKQQRITIGVCSLHLSSLR